MRLFLIAALAVVVACTPAEETDAMSGGCDARAVSEWVAGDARFSLEATTVGPDCARAVATLVVRDSSGAPAYAQAHVAAHVMTLAPAADPGAMQAALAEWIEVSNNTAMTTTAALPEWPANAQSPESGEFPFYVDDAWNDRAGYEELRAGARPMFCYVQGMESLACLALFRDQLEKIGVQSFPG